MCMKRNRASLLVLLILFSLFLIAALLPDAPASSYYENVPRPLVIAHQGGDRLWPGNTSYAFENAVEIGADVLEMDAHVTSDGHIVLMHDEEVDRTTDGTGLVEDLTLAQL